MFSPQKSRLLVALSLIVLIAGMLIWSTRQVSEPRPVGSRPSAQPERDIPASSERPASSRPVDEGTTSRSSVDEAAAPGAPATAAARIAEPRATTPLPATAPVAGLDLTAELDQVQLALRDFRTVHGENPVGTNAEITRALMGDNLKQLKLSVPTGSQLNAAGELSDRWGTPYFFHQVSKTEMEVRSAGPDRTMWTNDDRQM